MGFQGCPSGQPFLVVSYSTKVFRRVIKANSDHKHSKNSQTDSHRENLSEPIHNRINRTNQ